MMVNNLLWRTGMVKARCLWEDSEVILSGDVELKGVGFDDILSDELRIAVDGGELEIVLPGGGWKLVHCYPEVLFPFHGGQLALWVSKKDWRVACDSISMLEITLC